jgi:hypothetical protein
LGEDRVVDGAENACIFMNHARPDFSALSFDHPRHFSITRGTLTDQQ